MRTLNEITGGLEYELYGDPEAKVSGIKYDSREVLKGDMFVCFEGTRTDGKLFVSDAIARGAGVVVAGEKIDCPPGVTLLVIKDRQKALPVLSANFYDNPSRKLTLIGITGTNGKTTTTYLIESIFRRAKIPVAVLGTVNYRVGDRIFSPKTTTPQASDLQYMLDLAVKSGIKAVVMEVSSHALALGRVDRCEFDVGIFTNLTRDHLDFHKTMDGYFNEKMKLFKMLSGESAKKGGKFAVINRDDSYGSAISGEAGVPVITYGLNRKLDVSANNVKMNHSSMGIRIYTKEGNIDISTQLVGKYNIYNILAACACAITQGIGPEDIKAGIESVKSVPGRLERVDCGQPFTVLVDYAHTDDALYNVLSTIRELKPKRVLTVFGCGGDRDRSKRPLMGEVAVNLSDYAIITNDNPRSEDPQKIVLDIEVGIRKKGKENYKVVLDREKAISEIINMADKNDIVLLAGKGHENYQIIGSSRIPFSDREMACKYLRERFKAK
jgi:UDP-N-acetylmuramoyl-L-alanyl-D-glutamate--2,6-diaminopimelate ligase